jgi:hypothetical protein
MCFVDFVGIIDKIADRMQWWKIQRGTVTFGREMNIVER